MQANSVSGASKGAVSFEEGRYRSKWLELHQHRRPGVFSPGFHNLSPFNLSGRIARIKQYYSTGGVIMIWARWVPGFIIHGPPGDVGLVGRPVVSWVAQGI